MSPTFSRVFTDDAPGEFRAVLADRDGRASALFVQRWDGNADRARYGDITQARIRAFAPEAGGAFLELRSGEEAFARLKSDTGLTEGAILSVDIRSEARGDKLARAEPTDLEATEMTAFSRWCSLFPGGGTLVPEAAPDRVAAAFEDIETQSVTLEGGGQLHIERTRALVAVDIDTAGRLGRGSAAARALTINREAAAEVARQMNLRGLGGNIVVDCVGPLNQSASEQIRTAARRGLDTYAITQAKVLKPSSIGLLQLSLPWRFMPIEDQLSLNPGETELIELLRQLRDEATQNPMQLYTLMLGGSAREAYLARTPDVTRAVERHFGARVIIDHAANAKSEIVKR